MGGVGRWSPTPLTTQQSNADGGDSNAEEGGALSHDAAIRRRGACAGQQRRGAQRRGRQRGAQLRGRQGGAQCHVRQGGMTREVVAARRKVV